MKAIIAWLGLFLAGSTTRASDYYQMLSEPDTVVKAADMAIFSLTPIKKKSKNRIKIYYNSQGHLLRFTIKGIGDTQVYNYFEAKDMAGFSRIDTVGMEKYKRIYDTIIISKNRIIYSRKMLASDGMLMRNEIKILDINPDGTGRYLHFTPSDDFNTQQLISLVNDSSGSFLKSAENIEIQAFRLAKRNNTYYYHDKSLFWETIGFYLGFYIHRNENSP
jgi:hypothetical protein